jgi:hypothetical protein
MRPYNDFHSSAQNRAQLWKRLMDKDKFEKRLFGADVAARVGGEPSFA